MKTAFVVGMLTLSTTVAGAHNKNSPDSGTIMRANATAGIGPGAGANKVRGHSHPTQEQPTKHLTQKRGPPSFRRQKNETSLLRAWHDLLVEPPHPGWRAICP